jgi:S-formylglutathione hydrolase FrmB
MPARLLLALLTVAAVVALAAPAALLAPPASAASAADLQLVGQVQLDDRLSELTFTTPALADPVKVRVLLPRGAGDHPDARYSVLYLLHGSPGDSAYWTLLDAEGIIEGLPVIVVMPDAGEGWYSNPNNGAQPRWEDFHIGELLPWIDAHEPTIPDRAHRAIGGLSMGGFGAMSYAARHPDLFAGAASFSGAVDLNLPACCPGGLVGDDGPWGPFTAPAINWEGHNPVNLAANLRGLALWIYTGNGQPGGAFGGGGAYDQTEPMIEQESASFAARLASLGIPRTFDDYGSGAHEPLYWEDDLRRTLPGLMDVFAHPQPAPVPFSFTATESTFAIRGYSVRSHHSGLAFRTLKNVRAAGFALSTPDGPATVTTAPRYRGGARYRLRVRVGAPGRVVRTVTHTVRASGAGRLTVVLPGTASVGITRLTAAP